MNLFTQRRLRCTAQNILYVSINLHLVYGFGVGFFFFYILVYIMNLNQNPHIVFTMYWKDCLLIIIFIVWFTAVL